MWPGDAGIDDGRMNALQLTISRQNRPPVSYSWAAAARDQVERAIRTIPPMAHNEDMLQALRQVRNELAKRQADSHRQAA